MDGEEHKRAHGVREIRVGLVHVVSWIPYLDSIERAPAAYRDHPMGRRALSKVFRSGNHRPPPWFEDLGELNEFEHERDFRCILALPALIARCEGSEVAELEFETKPVCKIGYTPVHIPRSTVHLQGTGGLRPLRKEIGEGVGQVEVEVRFRLSGLGAAVNFISTARGTPFAWTEVDYTVYADGRYTISLVGTMIPSHALYLNLERRILHDMLTLERDDIDNFLEAGNMKPAPGSVLGEYVYEEQDSSVH